MKYIHRLLRYFSAATCLSASLTAFTAAQPPSGPSPAVTSLPAYAGAGMIDAATTLLDGGANVNERDSRSGDTPLMRAARNGRSEMVLFLLKRGADAKATNSRGETALTSFGGSCISPDAAKALVAGAGNPKEEMHTALLHAAGALGQQVSCLSLVKFFIENGADPNYQDGFGNTALISASRWGHREVVRFLLTKGADTSLKTKDGFTALDEAANSEIRRMLRSSTGLAETTASQPTLSHGVTPDAQAVLTMALVEKCKADQPSMSVGLDASYSSWETRNRKYVVAAKKSGEMEFRKSLASARETYDQQGSFPQAHCQKLIKGLSSQELDIAED